MKLNIHSLITIFIPLLSSSQNIPACDSIEIDCCTLNSISFESINIQVSNYSSDIFSYPGFILFTEEMDTVAIETVNYYGIGWDQTHILDIIHPIELPFEGILELHTGFYNFHACTFPFTIEDSIATSSTEQAIGTFKVFPNPATNEIILEINELESIEIITILDVTGLPEIEIPKPESKVINLSKLNAGIYFVLIQKSNGEIKRSKFLKK
jgi:hypothetical protein